MALVARTQRLLQLCCAFFAELCFVLQAIHLSVSSSQVGIEKACTY